MSHNIKLLILLAVVMLAALLVYQFRFSHADALWKIVSQQCVPHMEQEHNPQPCVEVDTPAGFVVFKDKNGPLQYLLMPTAKISGIESPQLLAASSPNYSLMPGKLATLWRINMVHPLMTRISR